MIGLFNAAVFEPIYNALAFFVYLVPGHDVGVAMVVVTLIVRLVLFPLSLGAARTQVAMQEVNPKLEALKAELKDDKEALAKRTMELFKEHNINPFSSILLLIVQLPIVIGLYSVFLREAHATSFDPTLLYSYIHVPDSVSFSFLNLIDLKGKSIVLALLVTLSQVYFARLTMPQKPQATGNSFRDDLSHSMHIQMRYVFPLMIGVIAYIGNGAVALYFLVSNIFGIVQTVAVKRIHARHEEPKNDS
jgi:YidC/Oxa1 family membrane protein insertase